MLEKSKFEDSTKYNVDYFIILFIPLFVLIFIFLGINNDRIFYFVGILLSIFIYELLIYNKRDIFGFSGVRYLSVPSIVLFSYTLIISLPSIYIFLYKDYHLITYFIVIAQFYFIYPFGLYISSRIHKYG